MREDLEDEVRTLAQRCVSTCRHRHCTGLGSLEHYAHVCAVIGIPRAVPTCVVPSCDKPGRLYLGGRLCTVHGPEAVPVPAASTRPTPSDSSPWPMRAPEDYGTATDDPLGRNAPEWIVSDRTGLPVRVKP